MSIDFLNANIINAFLLTFLDAQSQQIIYQLAFCISIYFIDKTYFQSEKNFKTCLLFCLLQCLLIFFSFNSSKVWHLLRKHLILPVDYTEMTVVVWLCHTLGRYGKCSLDILWHTCISYPVLSISRDQVLNFGWNYCLLKGNCWVPKGTLLVHVDSPTTSTNKPQNNV